MSDPSTFKRMEEAKNRREALAKKEEKLNQRNNTGRTNNSGRTDYSQDANYGAAYKSFDKSPRTQNQNTKPQWTTPRVANQKKKPVAKTAESPGTDYTVVKSLADASSDVLVEKFTIHKDEVVCFHGDQHWMSTFYPITVTIEGHTYPSVEHYYQACKLYMLADPSMAEQIAKIENPLRAKVATKKLLRKSGVTNKQMDDWKMQSGPTVIRHAQLHKFMQHADLRAQLLATGDSLLAHVYEGDKVYGCGMNDVAFNDWVDKNDNVTISLPTTLEPSTLPYFPLIGAGKNVLGIIMMRVRTDCRLMQSAKETGDTLPEGDETLLAAFKSFKLEENSETSSSVETVIEVPKMQIKQEAKD